MQQNYLIFFFSSRRRHTRFDCDWSSDVCSSDLIAVDPEHKQDYLNYLADYLRRLDQAQKTLQERVARLQDRRIITHHPAWPYFARRFGFQIEEIGRASCRERV